MPEENDSDATAKFAAGLHDVVDEHCKPAINLGRTDQKLSAEELIAAISDPDGPDHGTLTNELLAKFGGDCPVENLRPLLRSSNDRAVGSAAFSIAELRERSRPLMNDIVPLLDHSSVLTRSDAMEALQACTTWVDKEILSRLLLGLGDPHRLIRYRAMSFVRLSERKSLISALEHAAEACPGTVFAKLRRAYGRVEYGQVDYLQWLLGHEDPVMRRFAIALSLRPRLVVDQSWVALATTAFREDLGDMADTLEFQQRPLPTYAISSTDLVVRD